MSPAVACFACVRSFPAPCLFLKRPVPARVVSAYCEVHETGWDVAAQFWAAGYSSPDLPLRRLGPSRISWGQFEALWHAVPRSKPEQLRGQPLTVKGLTHEGLGRRERISDVDLASGYWILHSSLAHKQETSLTRDGVAALSSFSLPYWSAKKRTAGKKSERPQCPAKSRTKNTLRFSGGNGDFPAACQARP